MGRTLRLPVDHQHALAHTKVPRDDLVPRHRARWRDGVRDIRRSFRRDDWSHNGWPLRRDSCSRTIRVASLRSRALATGIGLVARRSIVRDRCCRSVPNSIRDHDESHLDRHSDGGFGLGWLVHDGGRSSHERGQHAQEVQSRNRSLTGSIDTGSGIRFRT